MPTFIIETIDKPNRNNRIYTKACIEKAISDTKKLVEERRFMGELHETTSYHDTTVNLMRASHLVTELRLEESRFVADVQILKTPMGIVLQRLVDSDQVYFVPRGIGKLEENGTVTDYTLISIDAYPKPPLKTL